MTNTCKFKIDYNKNLVALLEIVFLKDFKRMETSGAMPSLYPSLPTENDATLKLMDKLSQQRCEIIKKQVQELEEKAKHYEKLRKKWSKALTGIRIIGTGFGSLITFAGAAIAIVTSSGTLIPLIVPSVIASAGAIQTASSEIAALTFIKNRIKKYREKVKLIDKFVNRLYHFYLRAIEDAKITPSEMEEFYKIIDAFKSETEKSNDENEIAFDLNTIRQAANAEAKKEAATEVMEKMKQKEKARLLSSVST